MTRARKVVVVVFVVLAALGVLGVLAYVAYVGVMVALLHAAFNPPCPAAYEKLTNACGALSRRDPAVHCNSSREGPIPSGPQGVCESFNRVRLDWDPSPDAGWQAQPSELGSVDETKDASSDAGAWSCESDGLTFAIEPAAERSPEELTRIRAAFDEACTAFKSR